MSQPTKVLVVTAKAARDLKKVQRVCFTLQQSCFRLALPQALSYVGDLRIFYNGSSAIACKKRALRLYRRALLGSLRVSVAHSVHRCTAYCTQVVELCTLFDC
jgi:hypothetical protein